MNISPETLKEEEDRERVERERRSGVLREGKLVECYPDPINAPDLTEVKSRVVCLTKPFAHCQICNHSSFSLIFRADAKERLSEVVMCPRWKNIVDRFDGKSPECYVPTEVSTCKNMPLEYCPSCPKAEEVQKYGANKSKDGWYGRWHRLKKLSFEDSND